MSLSEYARKRTFRDTPEPAAGVGRGASSGDPSFCVQRHDATRLHYDFRLEIGGVLKSWAVPKGPSLDPARKRLAAHVEDHPLEYGDFEGVIPQGHYGAGSVMLWDRGVWELLGHKPVAEQLARGDLKFRLHGEKLRGEFALVRMKGRGKGNEWLLIKKRDAHAVPGWEIEDYATSVLTGRTQEEIAQGFQANPGGSQTSDPPISPSQLDGAKESGLPARISPMLATLTDKPPVGDDWLFEVKWDGVRAVCYIDGGRIRILTRAGNSCERQYPELDVLPHLIAAGQAILDGEIVVLDEKGVSRFALLQPRISTSDASAVAHLARSRPVTFFAFDLLYLDGYDLRGVPLIRRKQALEAILEPSSVLRYSEHFAGAGAEMLEAARDNGLEGVIAKRAGSHYASGRNREWLKLKVVTRQEFIIAGITGGEREYFSSLALGIYEKRKLVYVGNVGTGFDQDSLKAVYERLHPLSVPKSPFADPPKIARPITWVRPEVVCEVQFASWTRDGRLRSPVFLGLRTDIEPRQCVRESEVAVDPPFLPGKQDEVSLSLEGRSLTFTNLNKTFYPAEGYTKRDLLNYYDAVADFLLPHLQDRPLSLKRYPDGIEGESFFQKDAPESFAPWLRTEHIESESEDGPTRYVVGGDRAGLLYLVNLGCIDHNPWMSRVGSLDTPDFILIDLDAYECPYERIVEAARLVRKKLDLLELESYPKTTGGDGMHIYIPLEPVYTYEETRSFAEILAGLVLAERPDLFTSPRSVSKRKKGLVYFDYLQNGRGKTVAAPYVLRAHPGAPVAAPLKWREVRRGLSLHRFHIRNALSRFDKIGDLFEPVLTHRQRLEHSLDKLESILHREGKPGGKTRD